VFINQLYYLNKLLLLKEGEMYWPDENAPMTFGLTTVTHKGTNSMGNTTELKLESTRFGKV